MGRNIKKGLEYYPMDVDVVSDIKIRKLIKRHKGQAFAVYTLLLCCIYKNGYYINWDDDLPFILAEQTGFTEKYILQVINYCISVGLFSEQQYESNKILTSRAIQERYSFICRQGKRKSPIRDYALISSEETTANNPPNERPQEQHIPRRQVDIYKELGKYAQCRQDVWEAAAISGNFTNGYSEQYLGWLQWDDERKNKYPLHQLNATLRKQCGDINIDWYNAIYWCKDNLLVSQFNDIYQILAEKPAALSELQKLIKEIDRGKINNPGLFITKNLKKL